MQIMHFFRVECNMLGTITSIGNNTGKTHCIDCMALNCIIALRCIALIALHRIRTCLESFVGYPEVSQWPLDFITPFQHCIIALLHCVALHCIACIAWHRIRTCLESFVGYPEISQWSLDLITRFHAQVLMNAFTLAFAYAMFGIFCEIRRNQSMVPRFYYSDSCT